METKGINIIPISMRCTQEQYESIKPILDANGISNDFVFSYADTFLVTNYSDDIVVMNTLSIDAEKFGHTLFTEWDEKIFLKCLGIETKELKEGDYIRGFNTKGAIHTLDDKYVGSIAKVIDVNSINGNGLIQVEFSDGYKYYYSYSKAIEHLCNEDMEMFKKGLDANAKMFNEINKTEIENKLNKCKREVKDPLKDTPFNKPDFSHLKDFDKVLEKGIKNSGLNDKPIEELEEHLKDNINPQHYKNKPKETIERIGDNLSLCEFKGYIKGNILKYLDRYENKNGVEDLKKANWYLNKLIEIENGKA